SALPESACDPRYSGSSGGGGHSSDALPRLRSPRGSSSSHDPWQTVQSPPAGLDPAITLLTSIDRRRRTHPTKRYRALRWHPPAPFAPDSARWSQRPVTAGGGASGLVTRESLAAE